LTLLAASVSTTTAAKKSRLLQAYSTSPVAPLAAASMPHNNNEPSRVLQSIVETNLCALGGCGNIPIFVANPTVGSPPTIIPEFCMKGFKYVKIDEGGKSYAKCVLDAAYDDCLRSEEYGCFLCPSPK
jgi:hypothetical protein